MVPFQRRVLRQHIAIVLIQTVMMRHQRSRIGQKKRFQFRGKKQINQRATDIVKSGRAVLKSLQEASSDKGERRDETRQFPTGPFTHSMSFDCFPWLGHSSRLCRCSRKARLMGLPLPVRLYFQHELTFLQFCFPLYTATKIILPTV